MAVDQTHPAYDAALPTWTLCRDVAAGARVVKSKGSAYLLKPSGMSLEDSRHYSERAALFSALPRTIMALSGAIFTKPPVVEGVPAALLPQLEDVTLRDESLEDVAHMAVEEVLRVGRFGILVDMPESGASGSRPYWCLVPAERIVNWRTARVGDDPEQLVQLVLREDVDVPTADGFGRKTVAQFRELALAAGDQGFVYQVRTWTKSDPAYVVSTVNTPFTAGEWITPLRRGVPLDFIPFTFVGPAGVTPDVAKPPLEDLADVVIAHFRNSADLEWGLFLVALPTPYASGVVGDGKAPLKIGPSVVWMLEKEGKAGLLEFTGAGLAAIKEAMAAKERHMAVLGGRLLLEEANAKNAETATSARLRYSAEAASLRTIAGAVAAALTRALRWHVWWTSTGEALPLSVEVRLSDEFFQVRASADEVRAALLAVQAEQMSFKSFFAFLQRGGWARPGVTVEQERAEILGQGSGGGALDDGGDPSLLPPPAPKTIEVQRDGAGRPIKYVVVDGGMP